MNSFSPIGASFRLLFRRPLIPIAEIAWRWSFAAAAWVLGAMFIAEYLDSLPVKRLDRALLASSQPILISRALHRILQGSAFRFTEAGIVLFVGLAIAWIALASLGRAATVSSMLEEFRIAWSRPALTALGSLAALNSLRLVLTLAAVVGTAGAALAASSLPASTRVTAADAARLFALVLFLVWLSWVALNWLLSIASIFAVTERGGVEAAASVLRLLRKRTGAMLVTGLLFGFAHVGLFLAASGIGLSILAAVSGLGPVPVVFLEFATIAGYCAVADFLYVGRLAAYIEILQWDEADAVAARGATPGLEPADFPARVDPDDLILSDVPLPAT